MINARRLLIVVLALLLSIPSFAAHGGRLTAGWTVEAYASETRIVEEGAYVRIKNKWQSNYLYEDSNGTVRYGFPGIDEPRAQWMFEATPDGGTQVYRIRNRETGHYITIADVSARRDPLTSKAIGTSMADDQWIVEAAVNRPGYVTIRSAKHPESNYYIHQEDQLGFAEVSMDIGAEWESPQWLLEPAHDAKPVRIYNAYRGQYLYEVTDDGEHKGKAAYGDVPMNDPASHWFVDVLAVGDNGAQTVRLRNRVSGNVITQGILWAEIRALAPSESTKTHWIMRDVLDEHGEANGFVTFQNVYAIDGDSGELEGENGTFVLNTQFDDIYARSNNWAEPSWGSAHWRLETASDVLPTRLASYGDISDESSKRYLYDDDGTVRYGTSPADDQVYLWLFEDYDGRNIIRNAATGRLMTGNLEDAPDDPLQSQVAQASEPAAQWILHESDLYDDFVAIQSNIGDGRYIHLARQLGYAQIGEVEPTINEAQWFMERPGAPGEGEAQYVLIQNVWNSLFMIEDENGELKYGNVRADDHRGHWLIENYNGRKRIQNRATGHYLNVFDQPNGHIQVSPVDFSAADQEELLPALWRVKRNGNIWNSQDLNLTPGQTKYLNIENLSKYVEYNMINPNYGSARWQFIPAPDEDAGYKRIRNKATGSYVFELDGKAAYGDPATIDPSSHWMIMEDAGGRITLQNRESGRYISIEGAGADDLRNPLYAAKMLEGPILPSYTWSVIEDVYGYKTLMSGWTSEHYLNVIDDLGYVQSSSHQEVPNILELDAAKFAFEDAPEIDLFDIPDDYVRIKSVLDGSYLHENETGIVVQGDIAANNAYSHWLIDSSNGVQRIRNRATGHYMTMTRDYSYILSAADSTAKTSESEWVLEPAPVGGHYMIRSDNGEYNDEYLHVQQQFGYPERGLLPNTYASLHWTLEAAPVEAVTPNPPAEGTEETATKVLSDTNFIRIVNKASGEMLRDEGGRAAFAAADDTDVNDHAAQWLLQDYNGRKLIRNRATGRWLAASADGAVAVSGGKETAAQWTIEQVLGYHRIESAKLSGRYMQWVETAGKDETAMAADAAETAETADAAGQAVLDLMAGDAALWTFEDVVRDIVYEAEKAFTGGNVRAVDTAAGSYLDSFAEAGDRAIFAVNGHTNQNYTVTIRYANRQADTQMLSVLVNGLDIATVSFAPGGSADEWREAELTVPLRKGITRSRWKGMLVILETS